ncbi:MAG: hypothetical protein ABI167_05325 [Nitrosospira sp.]
MNHTSILKKLTIAWSAALVIVMAFGMADSSHAQTGSVEQHGAPVSRQDGSLAGQPSSGPENARTDQRSSPSKSDESAPRQDVPAQSEAASSRACAEEKSTSCAQPAPEQESFLHKLIRILYGPNTPPGPNPDVDTNISAGGAAGG